MAGTCGQGETACVHHAGLSYHHVATVESGVERVGLELVLVLNLVTFELRQRHAVAGHLFRNKVKAVGVHRNGLSAAYFGVCRLV